ncbi:MAG: 30S ribosomal protein S8e [Candidatus Aenigmarchaeota archaeon]|nr:30S ribosomal protein S8e [Candidatus Aenigmarchaeota archaeon]
MARWHIRSQRSPTGRLMHRIRKKRRRDRGLEFVETRVQERTVKQQRALGGSIKVKLLAEQTANVVNPKTKKVVRSKILTVQGNPANPHYIRRNIITKGAVIKTEAGLARVTSRPGQHGVVNAVLLEKS